MGKTWLEGGGHEPAEEAGAEHDAGDHFAHDLGLAESDEEVAHDPAEGEDQTCLKDEKEDEISGLH